MSSVNLTQKQSMRFHSSRQLIGLALLLATADAAYSDNAQANPPPPGAAASSVRAATAEDGKVFASSALGACFRRPPQYPAAALRDDQQGTTLVSFEVSASGVAEGPAVRRSSQFALLDEAALNHMEKCIQSTARETDGTLPPGRYALPMTWRLE
jgi:TonB family protein